jgi:hypothetical protein
LGALQHVGGQSDGEGAGVAHGDVVSQDLA